MTGPLSTTTAAQPVRVGRDWLALREPADADARAADLVEQLRPDLGAIDQAVIHDLGCGTGSMGRWLAPRLAGRQHWICCDRDPELLAVAVTDLPTRAADGASVTVEARRRDITRLAPAELAGASLITASALLDMLTGDELDRFVTTCGGAGCPVLVTLSVIGTVELRPADRLDARIADAFNAHQRRSAGGRRLLGPDAVDRAADAFAALGFDVQVRPSPWRLGASRSDLAAQWFSGWVDAAHEQEPELISATATYTARRRAEAAAGRLTVTVQHRDLLARPR